MFVHLRLLATLIGNMLLEGRCKGLDPVLCPSSEFRGLNRGGKPAHCRNTNLTFVFVCSGPSQVHTTHRLLVRVAWLVGLRLTLSFSLCSSLLFSRGSAKSFQLSEKMPEKLTRCWEAATLFWKVLLLGFACWQESPVFDGGHPAAGWGM